MNDEKSNRIETERLDSVILSYCVQDESFFLKLKPYMYTGKSKCYFNDARYQLIFNILCKHYEEFKRIPPLENVLVRIEAGYKNDENMKLYVSNIAKKAYVAD
ncbi:MAG: hypothetical protein ABSG38_15515 [Spirochaetia bacterium]|jgi:hypothetical protein